MNSIVFSDEAIKDLQGIKDYISDELLNSVAADNSVSKILRSIRILGDFPESGSPLSSIINYDSEYRFVVCGSYISFYTYENETVYIHRILYGKRNYLRILFNNETE